jgi:carbonic anhydrase/acetyltransferase-like protein (isoleucine patch superfamily)
MDGMAIRSFDGMEPEIHETAFVHPAAEVIGDVTLEADVSVWPNTTLRGDRGSIVLREGANVQDNAVVHEGATIGPYATVGHSAIVHSATTGERSLVGMNAVVLDDSTVGDRAMVGACALVTEGTDIPPRTLAVGQPAEVKKEVEESPWAYTGDAYTHYADDHRETSEVIAHGHPPVDDAPDA